MNSGLLDQDEYLPKARAAAQKALELDDRLADGHFALANLMTYAWEWTGAEREYRRAIELNPNLALAHRWYAAYLRLMGRHEQAIAEISRARELDPLSPGVNATVGYVLSSARRFDEAIGALNRTVDLDPKYPYAHLFFGHTYAAQGKYAEAVAAYTRATVLGLDTPATQIYLGAASAHAGDRPRALAILQQLQSSKTYVSAAELAILLTALGDRERALAWLEDAYRAHDTSAAVPGRGAGPRSATLGPALCGPGATRRPGAMINRPMTTCLSERGGLALLGNADAPLHHTVCRACTGPPRGPDTF